MDWISCSTFISSRLILSRHASRRTFCSTDVVKSCGRSIYQQTTPFVHTRNILEVTGLYLNLIWFGFECIVWTVVETCYCFAFLASVIRIQTDANTDTIDQPVTIPVLVNRRLVLSWPIRLRIKYCILRMILDLLLATCYLLIICLSTLMVRNNVVSQCDSMRGMEWNGT